MRTLLFVALTTMIASVTTYLEAALVLEVWARWPIPSEAVLVFVWIGALLLVVAFVLYKLVERLTSTPESLADDRRAQESAEAVRRADRLATMRPRR